MRSYAVPLRFCYEQNVNQNNGTVYIFEKLDHRDTELFRYRCLLFPIWLL